MPKLAKIKDRFLKQREKFKKEIRIEIACSEEQYQAPCKQNQVKQYLTFHNLVDQDLTTPYVKF